MSELEVAFVRFMDLKEEKRRIEREMRLAEINREIDDICAKHLPPIPSIITAAVA
jgi:hypothetical protein